MIFSLFKKKNNDQQLIAAVVAARKVMADFGEVIENDKGGSAIKDEVQLPYSKEIIFSAIRIVLRIEENKDMAGATEVCAFALSFYQKGVGSDPLFPIGVDVSKIDLTALEPNELANILTSNPAGKERYDHFKGLVDADWRRMSSVIAAIPRPA